MKFSKLKIQSGITSILIALFLFTGAKASFTSIYAFGDGLSTTTSNPSAGPDYYGLRYCNGEIWIEVLCKWQGIAYVSTRNNSYYSHNTVALVTNATSFVAPPDVATSLFIVWCANADFVGYIFEDTTPPYTAANIPAWTSFIDGSIARHETVLNTLYNKGVRTLILPNAANITRIPQFLFDEQNKVFAGERTTEFNTKLKSLVATFMLNHPDMVIYQPDVFSLFENARTNPSSFGLIHDGLDAIAALGRPALNDAVGSNYLFWDDQHPTAKFQMYIADLSQQLISPPKVTAATFSSASGQIQVANIPLNRQGIVETSANLLPPWTEATSFTEEVNFTRSVPLTVTGPRRFYRVSFPVVWTWP